MEDSLSRRKYARTKRFVVKYRKNGKYSQKAAVVPYKMSIEKTKKLLDRMFSHDYYEENNIKESDEVFIMSITFHTKNTMSKSYQKRLAFIWV